MSDDELSDAQADESQVGFHVLRHYLKDLSIENPRGPLAGLRIGDLELGYEGGIRTRPVASDAQAAYDIVELSLTVTGRYQHQIAFLCEISYVAEVRLNNIPAPVRPQILHTQVPEALMPLVNEVLDLGARAIGYPGLEVPTPDFLATFVRALEAAPGDLQPDAATVN